MADFIPKQLPLAVHLRPDAKLSSLYVEPNRWFVDWLQSEWPSSRIPFCWLDAEPGSGLSHVIQAIAQQGEQLGQSVFYVSFAQAHQLSSEVLADLAGFDLLCLDDLDCIAGQPEWDLALLHCFNEMQAQQKQLVVGSHQALATLKPQMLPDLWSRMSSGLVVHWRRPEYWITAIEHVVQAQGMLMGAAARQYFAARAPRDWAQVMMLVNTLDQAALSAQRRITIPFIRQVLDW